MADAEADGQDDGVDGMLVPQRDGGEAEDGLAREKVDDVEEGEVDEQHVERRPHPRPARRFEIKLAPNHLSMPFNRFSMPFTRLQC